MGRGAATIEMATVSRTAGLVADSGRTLVERLDSKLGRGLREFDARTSASEVDVERLIELRQRAMERAIGSLSPAEQRQLVRTARSYEGPRQEWIRARSRELLLLAHGGTIAEMARLRAYTGIEDQVLRQRAAIALNRAIDGYDFEQGSNFLTYVRYEIQGAMMDEARRHSQPVKFSDHAAKIRERVEIALKIIDREQQRPTIENIAFWTSDSPEQIQPVLEWMQTGFVSLDTPLGENDEETIADNIASEERGYAEIEDDSHTQTNALRGALAQLPESEGFVVEQLFGYSGEAKQPIDLYQGLYLDADGNRYTSERHIETAVRGSGETIERRSRKELLQALRAGTVRYVASNPETERLYELLSAREGAPTPPSSDLLPTLRDSALRQIKDHLAPSAPAAGVAAPSADGKRKLKVARRADGRRLGVGDLVSAGALRAGPIVGEHKNLTFDAELLSDGRVRLSDGRLFPSLSKAASEVTGASWSGWEFWKMERNGQLVPLARIRDRFLAAA